MRSILPVLALLGLANAIPRPQDIDLVGVEASPDPVFVTPAVNVSEESGASNQPEIAPRSRISRRDGTCAAQPAGSGPVSSPDTPEAFLGNPVYGDTANNAPTPDGYTMVMQNGGASLSASNYMGLRTLKSYDTLGCASLCDQAAGCQAFNMYIERDPTLDPNSTNCPNPPSLTNYKCTLWGAPVSADEATNKGQWRDSFRVVIAGSNAYNSASPPPAVSCYTGPTKLPGAINAPLNAQGQNTYMGYKYHPFSQDQGYDPSTCAADCNSQTAYNKRHPAADGSYQSCIFFDAYVLSMNGIPQGLYCSMYSQVWAPSYATNYGQYRGTDRYTVSRSYSYSLNPVSDGICPGIPSTTSQSLTSQSSTSQASTSQTSASQSSSQSTVSQTTATSSVSESTTSAEPTTSAPTTAQSTASSTSMVSSSSSEVTTMAISTPSSTVPTTSSSTSAMATTSSSSSTVVPTTISSTSAMATTSSSSSTVVPTTSSSTSSMATTSSSSSSVVPTTSSSTSSMATTSSSSSSVVPTTSSSTSSMATTSSSSSSIVPTTSSSTSTKATTSSSSSSVVPTATSSTSTKATISSSSTSSSSTASPTPSNFCLQNPSTKEFASLAQNGNGLQFDPLGSKTLPTLFTLSSQYSNGILTSVKTGLIAVLNVPTFGTDGSTEGHVEGTTLDRVSNNKNYSPLECSISSASTLICRTAASYIRGNKKTAELDMTTKGNHGVDQYVFALSSVAGAVAVKVLPASACGPAYS